MRVFMAKKVVISEEVQAEVQAILDGLDMPLGKAARVLSKSFGKDAKLNRFLTKPVDQGYSFFTDAKRRANIMETILSGFGFTSVKNKQALIIKVLTAQVDSEIEAKRKEVSFGLELNTEQKEQLTKRLVEYRKFLVNDLQKAAHEIALTMGVTAEVNEPVEAPVEEVE